jgi:hypothetical protein
MTGEEAARATPAPPSRSEEVPPNCPSAQPGHPGAFAFGVFGGTPEDRRVAYLAERVPVTDELLALAGPVKPTEVFRFAAPCATSKCRHFDGHDCRLATKLVQMMPRATDALPACKLRPDCRWWQQEGKAACMVCPSVRTESYNLTEDQRRAADPEVVPA